MKRFLFCSLLSLLLLPSGTQDIFIQFDFSKATSTLDLLRENSINDDEVQQFLSPPGSRALLQKIKYNSDTSLVALARA